MLYIGELLETVSHTYNSDTCTEHDSNVGVHQCREKKSDDAKLMQLRWRLFFTPLAINSNFVCVQWRNDFVNSLVKLPDSHDTQEECLGMAVLDMTRTAKERQLSPLDIYHTIRWVTNRSVLYFTPTTVPALNWHRSFCARACVRAWWGCHFAMSQLSQYLWRCNCCVQFLCTMGAIQQDCVRL